LPWGTVMRGESARRARGLAAALVAVLVTAFAVASCGVPQPEDSQKREGPRTLTDRQFTGVWVGIGTFDEPAGPPPWQNTRWPAKPPFTEWGAAESARLADHRNFRACNPAGPVFFMSEVGLFPLQILEAPDQVVILREASGMPRRIYTDDRGHPADVEPSWMGHSTGHWDGDVLVVDTVGLNGKARAMNGVGANAQVSEDDAKPRMPSSEQLHLVERFKLVANGELLEDEITVNDPKAYTEPVVLKHYFQRRPDIDMLEYVCNENPRDDTVVSGAPQ
jgi:hypothetical protein